MTLQTLKDAAIEALSKCDGNAVRSTEMLYERAMNDHEFLRANFAQAIRVACYAAVSGVIRANRAAVWHTPQPSSADRRKEIEAMAAGTIRTLYDFPLPGGKRLGDATRAEIAAAALFYGALSRDMSWKSRWLDHVAQSVPDGKKVSDVLTAERLEELRQETTK